MYLAHGTQSFEKLKSVGVGCCVQKMEESKECKISEEEQTMLHRLRVRERELDKIYDEIRDHERSLESRIEMSKKEEVAREAMLEWLYEEIEILEAEVRELYEALTSAK